MAQVRIASAARGMRLSRAERIVDEVIESWEHALPYTSVTTVGVRRDVEAFLKTRGRYAWYVEVLSPNGWNELVQSRLKKAGYVKYVWGWGGKVAPR